VMLPSMNVTIGEVLDLRPSPDGEVLDDDDVVVLCQMRRFVRNRV
jgi:hypothetical protein